MTSFDAREYWEQRLSATYDVHGVGWAGMGRALNVWMYKVRRHVFLREMRRQFPRPQELDVLDVGSGTGFYVERWHELGARSVMGSDLTDTAVTALASQYPQDDFERLDISDAVLPIDRQFDVVSAFDVLFHIVDDERFAQALRNLCALVRPGGHVVFSDNFLHGPAVRIEHQASRSLADITCELNAAGLQVVRRVPMFVLLNTPLDSERRLAQWWWAFVSAIAARGELPGRLLGAAVYPFELGLLRVVREGPSTELMVCKRRADEAGR